MKNQRFAATVFAMGLLLLAASHRPAEARKEYFDAFLDEYPNLANQVNAKKCQVCHGPDNKRQRSEYAESLAEQLGARSVKDQDQIKVALQRTELLEVEPGKIYRDLFDAGTLPPPFVPPK